VAARTAELRASVDQLQASQTTIRELGSPVLPVLPGVLVAPLIGAIDTARAADLSAAVLAAVDRVRARSVILDITGVPVVDTHVARALLQVAQAVRLLGAEAVLVGVSAEVAQTLVTLGVDLGAIHVHANLQEAVGALISTTIATAR
jgi:anti-anti-sigma factor